MTKIKEEVMKVVNEKIEENIKNKNNKKIRE